MWGNKSQAPVKEEPPGQEDAGAVTVGDDGKTVSRRRFFKRAAVGAVALAGTAELAKQTANALVERTAQQRYDKDTQAGDAALEEREYVLMSDQEKKEMIQTFTDNYKKEV